MLVRCTNLKKVAIEPKHKGRKPDKKKEKSLRKNIEYDFKKKTEQHTLEFIQ